MEKDSIRASGRNTLVNIWIDGKVRAIRVSQEAIGAFVGFEQSAGMSDEDRCEFVMTNLQLIVMAAKTRLYQTDPAAETITIEAGHLPRPDGRLGERRRGDRRAEDRRKSGPAKDGLPPRDRRRSDRRTGERRRTPKKA